MAFYTSLFADSEVVSVERCGPGEQGTEGAVEHATFTLAGQRFMCIDSAVEHDWTFTPALSLYVSCDSEDEIDHLFERLSAGGQVFMALEAYPFAEKFAWLADRYGVSWQLALGPR